MINMNKILKVVEPDKKSHWALWSVTYEDKSGPGKSFTGMMNEDDYKRLMAGRKLIKKGADQKDLDEFEEAVRGIMRRQADEDAAGIDL